MTQNCIKTVKSLATGYPLILGFPMRKIPERRLKLKQLLFSFGSLPYNGELLCCANVAQEMTLYALDR